jgi:putative membrane protein
MARYLVMVVTVGTFLIATTVEGATKIDPKDITFLQNAAESQLATIAFAKLALKKASHKEVKAFGAEIIEDHQYASEEAKELSAEEEIYLPVQLGDQHETQKQRLSQLSGKAFDEAFMSYILKEHRKDMWELEKNVSTLQNEKVKSWASATLPILAVHLKKAERVAETLGFDK